MDETCACGHEVEEHIDDDTGRIDSCNIDDCGCVYFESADDDD